MKNKYIIAVVGRDLFPQRMHLEKEFGETMYDQLISVLKLVGKETDGYPHYRLGIYLDTKNPGAIYYELEEEVYDIIIEYFGHPFYKKLKDFGEREQKKGTEVLFQLNAGNISAKDFADRIKKV